MELQEKLTWQNCRVTATANSAIVIPLNVAYTTRILLKKQT